MSIDNYKKILFECTVIYVLYTLNIFFHFKLLLLTIINMSATTRKVEMITKVLLEGFPSRNEVLTLLDSFLSDHNYPLDYNVNTKDSLLIIMFKKPVYIYIYS